MEFNKSKTFEKPDAGMFLGTIIDVINMPQVQTTYGVKNKIRILWVLSKIDGTPALDSEGRPLTVHFMKPASWHEKSHLYSMISMILNGPPPLISEPDEIAALIIGRSNVLAITRVPNPQKQGDFFANVAGVLPLAPGQIPPSIPAGFIRSKDKPKPGQTVFTQPNSVPPAQLNQPAQTQQPPGQPVQNQVTPSNNVAF